VTKHSMRCIIILIIECVSVSVCECVSVSVWQCSVSVCQCGV
jgi:hypothetical protein